MQVVELGVWGGGGRGVTARIISSIIMEFTFYTMHFTVEGSSVVLLDEFHFVIFGGAA